MTDKNGSPHADPLRLVIVKGKDSGKTIELASNREYVIGRSDQCDICVDQSDKSVSRRHALLKTGTASVAIESLSPANPVLIKGKPIAGTTLKKSNSEFQIGETVFALNMSKETKAPFSFKPDKKISAVAGVVAVSLLLLLILFTGREDGGDQPLSVTRPGPETPDLPPLTPSAEPGALSSLPEVSGIIVSDEDRASADRHFRQGMFFYDTGNILRAVNEWERALSFNPEHADARIWFLNAEKELAEMVRKHYQNAMLHYKYMRYNQAASEFQMVLQLSRDKNSEQYNNALKHLDEIQGKR